MSLIELFAGIEFDAPFFEGESLVAPGIPQPFDVGIQGRPYLLDWQYFKRGVIGGLRPAQDQNAIPGEVSLNPAGAWKRNRDDWSLGEGQYWADRALTPNQEKIEIEPRMYWLGVGIDPWTPGEVKLLREPEVARSSSTTNQQVLTVGGYLYLVDGANLLRFDNPVAAAPLSPSATITPSVGNFILDIATDGQRIFISVNAVGMFTSTIGSGTAAAMAGAAATYKPTVLGWHNGWLFGALNNEIKEIRETGALATVFTHRNTSFIFNSFASSPKWIYAGGNGNFGDVAEIFKWTTDSAGALTAATFAGGLPRGEILMALEFYAGKMFVGLYFNMRTMLQDNDGGLTVQPKLNIGNNRVAAFCPEGEFVWFSWGNQGLGRLSVARSTDPDLFVPAYARDIQHIDFGGWVTSVARYGEFHTFFVNYNTGLIRSNLTKYVTEGRLEMGRFRWGTYEPKTFLGMEVVTQNLPAGSDIDLAVDTYLDWYEIGSREGAETNGAGDVIGVGMVPGIQDWIAPELYIHPTVDQTQTPIVHRITLRALPVPKSVESIELPIMLGDYVKDGVGEGQDHFFNSEDEFNFLKDLQVRGIAANIQIGNISFTGLIRDVHWLEESIDGLSRNRRGLRGILMVTVVTTET